MYYRDAAGVCIKARNYDSTIREGGQWCNGLGAGRVIARLMGLT